jgi:hypothetical protein
MNSTTHAQLETRLQKLERQNRMLMILLCIAGGLALLGATKESGGAGNVLTVGEPRTPRLALIDDTGRVVHSWTVHGGWVVEK